MKLDLNPSAAERWTRCTASPRFIAENRDRIPVDTSTSFSKEGTTAHEVAAALLEGRDIRLSECPTPVTPEMHWHAWNYCEYVEGLREKDSELIVERKFPLWYMPERNAKIDVAVLNKLHLHIVDYKYGEGVVVSPVENFQAAIYARCVIAEKFPNTSEVSRITIHIYQPRGREAAESPFHVWNTTWGELKEFTDDHVSDNAHAILKDREVDFSPSEEACRWCPAKGFCVARQESLLGEITALQPIGSQLPLATTLTIEQVATVQKHGDEIIKWVKDVQDYALDLMKAGTPVPGCKLVLSRGGNRYWTDQEAAAKLLLEQTVLRENEVWEKKLIGPATVEKLLGKGKMPAEVMNLIAKPPGQPVIAAEDDPREAIDAALPEHEFEKLSPEH